MMRKQKRLRTWAAMAALSALLFRTIVAGPVVGAMASTSQLDAFGNIICSSHGNEPAPVQPDQPVDHSRSHDCCLAGCPMGGESGSLSPAPTVLPARLAAFGRLSPHQETHIRQRFAYAPHNARAPPLKARKTT